MRRMPLIAVLLVVGCSRCGSDPAPVERAPVAAESTPAPTLPGELPEDLGQAVTALQARVAADPQDALIEPWVRAVVDRAAASKDAAALGAAGDALRQAGNPRLASALLRKASAQLEPKDDGIDHLVSLAAAKGELGLPLEAASVLEQALNKGQSTPDGWIALSRQYLAAERLGPARAAVTRGLRKHEGHEGLTLQGADVALARAAWDEALAATTENKSALAARIRLEALLAKNELEQAKATESVVDTADALSLAILGASSVLRGDADGRERRLAEARAALDTASDRTQAERAIAWAEQLKAGAFEPRRAFEALPRPGAVGVPPPLQLKQSSEAPPPPAER